MRAVAAKNCGLRETCLLVHIKSFTQLGAYKTQNVDDPARVG